MDKYRNHINEYVTRNNAERIANMSHLLSENSEQFVPFPEGSQRYKGSERRKSESHQAAAQSRIKYPSEKEMNSFINIVESIESKREYLINNIVTQKERIQDHFHKRSTSTNSNAIPKYALKAQMLKHGLPVKKTDTLEMLTGGVLSPKLPSLRNSVRN